MDIIQSKKELERKERNDAILAMYTRLVSEYPDLKPWRILRTIGVEFDLTPEGVKFVLVSMGAYCENKNADDNGEE